MRKQANPRILYIDDYTDSSKLIDMLLYIKKCKYDFSIADAPTRALELISSQKFDLYILEYKLPEMNGIKLCRGIRQTDKQTPILFFTGKAKNCDRDVALAAGATEYLMKPANLEQITLTIRHLLGEKAPNLASAAPSMPNYSLNSLS